MVVPTRGDVWWAHLGDPNGSGPGFRRPVVVVQSTVFNESRIATVVVAAITSNLQRADAPGNVRIGSRYSGLGLSSVVNVSQLLTIDKAALTERTATLPGRTMERIGRGLRLVLGV